MFYFLICLNVLCIFNTNSPRWLSAIHKSFQLLCLYCFMAPKGHWIVLVHKCWGQNACTSVRDSTPAQVLGTALLHKCWGQHACTSVGDSTLAQVFGTARLHKCLGQQACTSVGDSSPAQVLGTALQHKCWGQLSCTVLGTALQHKCWGQLSSTCWGQHACTSVGDSAPAGVQHFPGHAEYRVLAFEGIVSSSLGRSFACRKLTVK